MVAPVNGSNGSTPAGQLKKTDPTGSATGGSGSTTPTPTPTTTTTVAPPPAPDTGALAAGMVLAFQEAKSEIEARYGAQVRENRSTPPTAREEAVLQNAAAASAGAAADLLSAKPILQPDAEHTAAMQALDETGKAVRRSMEDIDKRADKLEETHRREEADEAAREDRERLTGLDRHGAKDPFAFRPEDPEKAPWKHHDPYAERAHEPYRQAMKDHRESRPSRALLTI